jgi:hypothetical protein
MEKQVRWHWCSIKLAKEEMRLKNVSVTLSHVGDEKIDFQAIMSPIFVLQFVAVHMPSTIAFP